MSGSAHGRYFERVIGLAIGIENNGHSDPDSDGAVKITGKIINAFTLAYYPVCLDMAGRMA
nr:hypothetical protein [uncultured Desulfobacter sp.]